MGWLILIGIIAFVIWLESNDDGKDNAAGAIASIAIGLAAGKALNNAITGGAPEGVGDDYKPGGKYEKGEY